MDFLEQIDKSSDPEISEIILNIYLVYKRARQATLIESVNISKATRVNTIKFLLNMCLEMNLIPIVEDATFGRYLIMKPDTAINYIKDIADKNPREKDTILGKYLGFLCLGHDFGNDKIDRVNITYNIDYKGKEYNYKVFVCEKSKINMKELEEQVKQETAFVESIIQKDSQDFKVDYSINLNASKTTRYNAIKSGDIDYILENVDDYLNDLYNYWCQDSILESIFENVIEDKEEFVKHKDLLETVWKEFVLKSLSDNLNPEYEGEEIDKKMKEFDNLIYDKYNYYITGRKLLQEWRKFLNNALSR